MPLLRNSHKVPKLAQIHDSICIPYRSASQEYIGLTGARIVDCLVVEEEILWSSGGRERGISRCNEPMNPGLTRSYSMSRSLWCWRSWHGACFSPTTSPR